MPSTPRRRVLLSVGGLLGFAGCYGENQSPTTGTADRERTTYPPQTDRPGWIGLEVENNHEETHQVRVAVTADPEGATTDAEKLFARTLTLRPQSEPEFNSVVRIPESGDRRVRVAAEFADGSGSSDDANNQSASETFTVSASAEYQRLFVTIDHGGVLELTQGTEPSEPIRTTARE